MGVNLSGLTRRTTACCPKDFAALDLACSREPRGINSRLCILLFFFVLTRTRHHPRLLERSPTRRIAYTHAPLKLCSYHTRDCCILLYRYYALLSTRATDRITLRNSRSDANGGFQNPVIRAWSIRGCEHVCYDQH